VNGPVFLGVDEQQQQYIFGTISTIETFPVDVQLGK
jgi:hypothetical protein